jgi:hypothetical protein
VRDVQPSRRTASDEPRRSGQRASRGYGGHPGRPDPREYADERDYADGGKGERVAARYDDGRGAESASQRRQDSLPAVRPRQARGKRADDDGDWPSTEWDELSDVDYWAEVASDKPLTTTARPAGQTRPARPDQNREAEIRQAQGGGPGPAPQRDRATHRDRPTHRDPVPQPDRAPRLPVRGRREPAAAVPPAATQQPEFTPAPVAATRAQPDAGQWSRSSPPGSRPDPRRSEPILASLGGQGLPAVPDDDPLTSPSFPRVPASDSRSYRNGRDHTPPAGSRIPAAYSVPTQQLAAYASPAGQLDGYGATGQQNAAERPSGYGQPAASADRTSSQPYRPAPPATSPAPASYRGHGGQAGSPARTAGYLAGQLPATGGAPPAPAPALRAAGNPYGSYVSPPVRSGPPNSSAGLPGNGTQPGYDGYAAGPSNGQREASYPQPATRGEIPVPPAGPGNGWYPGTAAGQVSAYRDVAPQPAGAGSHEAGYLNGSPRTEREEYPVGHEPAGYLPDGYPPRPRDGAGYAGPDPYGRDPYGGYPGYGTDR